MTRKIMDICEHGKHLVCIKRDDSNNPYRLYRMTGNHRKHIAKYGDFDSILFASLKELGYDRINVTL